MGTNAWSSEWPTEPGWYWFYGNYAGERASGMKPMLRPMEARQISNGIMYIGWGTFLYKHEFGTAQFLPLTEPQPPET